LLQNVFRQTKITFSQQQKGLKISLKQMETLMNYKNRQEKNRLRAYIRQIRQIIPGKINFRRQFLVKIALENQQRLNSKHFLYYEIFRKLLGKIDFQGAVYRMNHSYHELHTILNRVTEQINKKIENSKKDIQAKTDLINAHNPENILKKGFTLTLNDAGEIIKSMKDFNAEQGVKIKFADGITPRLKKETP
jgi:exonuclease VII large subunit